jgi:general L-amino acid transport system permease protein
MLEPIHSPPFTKHPVKWLHINLFSNWFNSLLTVFVAYAIFSYVPSLLDWALFSADWVGEKSSDCSGEGACWVFIDARMGQFLYGFYPTEEQWRVDLAFLFLIALSVPLFIEKVPRKSWIIGFLLIGYPIIANWLFSGGIFGMTVVDTEQWGGLMLTLIIAAVGIIASLPIGILLALGRRSEMPIIRWVCISFIEIIRGVPLITILFMASVMLPLFMPEGVTFDKLMRAMIGITLFQSAYMAEVIRGGLQAIPKGQYEAADALGLNYFQKMFLIILPQALKLVIPGIVNTFIALFKDTSLILIIGLFELSGIMKAALNDPEWLGFATEGYLFAALIYWMFCFSMSRYSMRIEEKLHTGHK